MPLTLVTGSAGQMKRLMAESLVTLLDVQTRDGNTYFWGTVGGTFNCRLDGTPQVYKPWLKSSGPWTQTLDARTDAGDIVLQNLSGNLIDRDVQKLLRAREFVGALCVARLYHLLLDAAWREVHGTLGDEAPQDDQVTFRVKDLFDTPAYALPPFDWQELCPWQFKAARCGSAGSAAVCDKLPTTCADGTHNAIERFGGVQAVITLPINGTTPLVVTPFGGGGGTGDPGGPDGKIQLVGG